MKDNLFEPYIKALKSIDSEEIKAVAACINLRSDGRIFLAGNGGSHTIAQHMASDLMKPVGDKEDNISRQAVNLSDNVALMTAISNDLGYENIFSHGAKWHNLSEEDALITFSVSGSSMNIHKLIHYARENDAFVLEIVGVEIKAMEPEFISDYRCLPVATGLGKHTPEHYYVCESVFSCVAHEIARQFHILRGNYSAEW